MTMNYDPIPGLDYDFLRYVGVYAENQRRIQSFYLPFFKACHHVVDLGCGDGDFVAILQENGVNVVGVDSDEKAHQAATAKQLPVILQDVFTYLHEAPDNSVDGIFCAHLVEHLPYPKVLELVQQAFRILQPGGKIILATPNVRSLFSHLEMFYLHFGHVSFYHPRLLGFFLEHEKFVQVELGENPFTASPLLPQVQHLLDQPRGAAAVDWGRGLLTYRQGIPPQGKTLLHQLSYRLKRWLVSLLVQPLTDSLTENINQLLDKQQEQHEVLARQLLALQAENKALAQSIQSLNGPFECYTSAIKPPQNQA